MAVKKRSRYPRSEQLFAAASRILPGGVDSPVRAFKSVGATPLFIVARAAARRSRTPTATRYIDYVMSWGPLIHGHAPKGLLKALARRGRARHQLRRADRARDAAGPARRDADAVDGAGPLRQLGDRSGDERSPRRARGDQARQDRQVRGLLPRPRRPVPGAGRIGSDDARRADQSRACPPPSAADTLSRATTISTRSKRLVDAASRTDRGGIRRADRRQHGPGAAGDGFLQRPARRSAIATASLLVFDEVISGFRAAAGGAQQLFGIRPDLTCLGKIIGGGLPVGAYGGTRERDGAGRAGRTRLPGGHAVGQSAGDDRRALVARTSCRRSCTSIWRSSGAQLAAGLADAARAADVPLQVNAFGSLLTPFFTDRPVRDYESALAADTARVRRDSSGACWREASIRRRRSSRRGSCRRRTPRATSTRRSKRRGMR